MKNRDHEFQEFFNSRSMLNKQYTSKISRFCQILYKWHNDFQQNFEETLDTLTKNSKIIETNQYHIEINEDFSRLSHNWIAWTESE